VDLHKGTQTYQCRFRACGCGRGIGQRALSMATQVLIDCVEQARAIEVRDTEQTRHLSTEAMQGVVLCDYEWSRVA